MLWKQNFHSYLHPRPAISSKVDFSNIFCNKSFAYFLGHFKLISTSLVGVLLLTTFIKGALVSDYFMGLKQVSTKYRVIPIIWLAVVICFIGVAYYLPL